jgi:hypothetical protein
VLFAPKNEIHFVHLLELWDEFEHDDLRHLGS